MTNSLGTTANVSRSLEEKSKTTKSIHVLFVTGESRFHATQLDPSWKTYRRGKMKLQLFLSNLMKKRFWGKSSTMRKSSERTFLRSAILLWAPQRKQRLNVSISARSKVLRSCLLSKQTSSDKSSTSGHRLPLNLHPFLKRQSPLGNLAQQNSKS